MNSTFTRVYSTCLCLSRKYTPIALRFLSSKLAWIWKRFINFNIIHSSYKIWSDLCSKRHPFDKWFAFSRRSLIVMSLVSIILPIFCYNFRQRPIRRKLLKWKPKLLIFAYNVSLFHPEIFLYIEVYCFLIPGLFFQRIFKMAWNVLRWNHINQNHSRTEIGFNNPGIIRTFLWIAFYTLSYFTIFDWTIKKILFNSDFCCFNRWCFQRGFLSNVNEIVDYWHEEVHAILSDIFEGSDDVIQIVFACVGDDVRAIEENWCMKHNVAFHHIMNYVRYRYNEPFRKSLVIRLLLSFQSCSYLLLVSRAIFCQQWKYDKYYDGIEEYHVKYAGNDPFDDSYQTLGYYGMEVWMNRSNVRWFNGYLQNVIFYIVGWLSKQYMVVKLRRRWTHFVFTSIVCAGWSLIPYNLSLVLRTRLVAEGNK